MFSKLSQTSKEALIICGVSLGGFTVAAAAGHVQAEIENFRSAGVTKQYLDPAPRKAEQPMEVKVADGKTVRLGFTP